MVSGLVTSPCDHSLIFSGEARLIRIALKLFTSSILYPPVGELSVASYQLSERITELTTDYRVLTTPLHSFSLVCFEAAEVDALKLAQDIGGGVVRQGYRHVVGGQHLD